MAEVILKDITKVYDDVITAVHDMNLTIQDKEFVVLVGPSGCGKTTTLRMVAGLEDPTKGQIYIDGKFCNDVAPKDRDIAMVFQNYALYPHMTVYDNIAYGLKMKKLPRAEVDRRVRDVAEILELTEFLNRKPKHLSGGQRQRVAIGRAMVREPKVFLMDEPLSNLDATLHMQMRAEIIKLRRRINTTFLYVTHDQVDAMTLGDRIVVMREGAVHQIGAPGQVFDKPVDTFVAGFIGVPAMNFFENSKLLLENGKYSVQIRSARFELDEFQQRALRQNGQEPGDIVCGIRPQHITVGEGPLKATVEVQELLGSDVNIHTRFGVDEVIMTAPAGDIDVDIVPGLQISFGAKPGKLQLFHPETGENLIWYDPASAAAHAPVCREYNFE